MLRQAFVKINPFRELISTDVHSILAYYDSETCFYRFGTKKDLGQKFPIFNLNRNKNPSSFYLLNFFQGELQFC